MGSIYIHDAATDLVIARDPTPEEAAQRAADEQEAATQAAAVAVVDGNRVTLQDRATQALAANRDFQQAAKAYLANPNPSPAQIRDQVAALTQFDLSVARQLNAIERLLLNELDGTD